MIKLYRGGSARAERRAGVLRLLTMHLEPNAVPVNAEIHIVDRLGTDQIEVFWNA